jgi:hypothetical protein
LDQLVFVQTRLASRTRTVEQPFHAFGVIAVNPIPQSLPVHAGVAGGLVAARSVQDRRQSQKPSRLVRVADAPSLAPQFLR